MSDKTGTEGIETFCNWFKERAEESKSATQWKIPLECIPDSKKVCLTVEEAREIFAIIEDCVSLDVIRMYKNLLDDFQKRIEQAEKCHE